MNRTDTQEVARCCSIGTPTLVSVSDKRVKYYRMSIIISRSIEETVARDAQSFGGKPPNPFDNLDTFIGWIVFDHPARKILALLSRRDIVTGLVSILVVNSEEVVNPVSRMSTF